MIFLEGNLLHNYTLVAPNRIWEQSVIEKFSKGEGEPLPLDPSPYHCTANLAPPKGRPWICQWIEHEVFLFKDQCMFRAAYVMENANYEEGGESSM